MLLFIPRAYLTRDGEGEGVIKIRDNCQVSLQVFPSKAGKERKGLVERQEGEEVGGLLARQSNK